MKFTVEINLPFKTPTINHLYGKSFKHNRPYIKPEAKKLRLEIEEIVQACAIPRDLMVDKKLNVIVEVHEDWFCKNGSVKKKDVANREKFLIDSIFNALSLEDKFIFDHRMIKVQDNEKEFAIIKIEVDDGAI